MTTPPNWSACANGIRKGLTAKETTTHDARHGQSRPLTFGDKTMTGYWKKRGFFDAYVRGRWIGRFADPDDAQRAIEETPK
jgi:hypothetical protein